nr:MAG TPA: hypothetical protein [Caudoviricetes sp.]
MKSYSVWLIVKLRRKSSLRGRSQCCIHPDTVFG